MEMKQQQCVVQDIEDNETEQYENVVDDGERGGRRS